MLKDFDDRFDRKMSQLDTKFTNMFEEMKKEIGVIRSEVYDAKIDISALKDKARYIEESVNFMENKIDDETENITDLLETII